jgi:hypothetical protein
VEEMKAGIYFAGEKKGNKEINVTDQVFKRKLEKFITPHKKTEIVATPQFK